MPWYVYVLQFVSGLLLANGIPHFVQGVSGHRFQSPFASPPGVGESSPLARISQTTFARRHLRSRFVF
jgi:hypothetical protein